MPTCLAPTSAFQEFAAAASGVTAPDSPTECPLARIDRWLDACRPGIARLREASEAIHAANTEMFGDRNCRLGFDAGDAGDVAQWVWKLAVRALDETFLKPQGLKVDAAAFAHEALGVRDSSDPDKVRQEGKLELWSRERLLAFFHKQFADVREVASGQLRERVLSGSFGGDTRPGDVVEIYSCLFSRDSRGRSVRSYETTNEERFADVVRYVIHVTTGEAVGNIVLPRFFGFRDGASEWDRAQLFKRQAAPFPGVRWLRFTADSHVQIALEAATLSRVQAQWDAERAREDER